MVIELMRGPETLYAIGARIQYVIDRNRANLLTSIYLILQSRLEPSQLEDFIRFYQEMLLGLSPAELERGTRPPNVDDLVEKINGFDVEKAIKSICVYLAELLRPPPPLEF